MKGYRTTDQIFFRSLKNRKVISEVEDEDGEIRINEEQILLDRELRQKSYLEFWTVVNFKALKG